MIMTREGWTFPPAVSLQTILWRLDLKWRGRAMSRCQNCAGLLAEAMVPVKEAGAAHT